MPYPDRERPYVFAGRGFDRATHRRTDGDWLRAAWVAGNSRCLVLRADGQVLVDTGAERLAWRQPTPGTATASFLGIDGEAALFAALDTDIQPTLAAGETYIDLRSAATRLPGAEAGLAAYARALLHWQSRKRFCGRCGAPTRIIEQGHRAQCSDAACGVEYFPRTDPAIIVLVSDGERCLLGRQASWPAGRYSTLAGFVEPGETLEDAVRREVAEETGVGVGRVDYAGSQPWPFPASLMLGFFAEAVDSTIAVGSELEHARWFSIDELDAELAAGSLLLSPRLSIARWLQETWYRKMTGRDVPSSSRKG